MKTFVKKLAIHTVRFIMKLFWIVPIHNNQIIFDSFGGEQYSDSPKYISDYLLKHNKNMRIVWALNSPEKFQDLIPDGIEIVRTSKLRYYILFFSSRAIVTNNSIRTFIPVRKNQILLNTWHGGGNYKKNGLAVSHTPYDVFYSRIQSDETTAYISSSKAIDTLVIDQSFDFHKEILRIGMPRNAMLLRQNPGVKEKVRACLGIPDNKGIVLYAPTFRGKAANGSMLQARQMFHITNVLKALKERTGKEYVFLFRAHHTFKATLTEKCYVDATDYPDMQELLYTADCLITDYSSCMWDMALTKKPILLYAPDAKEWLSKTGFYGDYYSLPFPIAQSEEGLLDNIAKFDHNAYALKVQQHLDELGSYERADSDELAAQWLIDKMKINRK